MSGVKRIYQVYFRFAIVLCVAMVGQDVILEGHLASNGTIMKTIRYDVFSYTVIYILLNLCNILIAHRQFDRKCAILYEDISVMAILISTFITEANPI